MIKVILIDDHALVRQWIRQLLQSTKEIQVIGEAHYGIEAVQIVREHRPHVTLLDFKLPDISGLEVTTRLLRVDPHLKILIVSAVTNDLFPFRLLEVGAIGYLPKIPRVTN